MKEEANLEDTKENAKLEIIDKKKDPSFNSTNFLKEEENNRLNVEKINKLNMELKACNAKHIKEIKQLMEKIKVVEEDRDQMRETVKATQTYLREKFVPDQNLNSILTKEIDSLKQIIEIKDKQIMQLKQNIVQDKVKEEIDSSVKMLSEFLKTYAETNEKIMSLIILTNNSIKYIDTVHLGRETFHTTQISSLTNELDFLRKTLQERDNVIKNSSNVNSKSYEIDFKACYEDMSCKYDDLLQKFNCLQNIMNSKMVEKFNAFALRNEELVKSNKIMELQVIELTNKCNSILKSKDAAIFLHITELEQLKAEKKNWNKKKKDMVKVFQEYGNGRVFNIKYHI